MRHALVGAGPGSLVRDRARRCGAENNDSTAILLKMSTTTWANTLARVLAKFGEFDFAAEIVPVFPVGTVGRYRLARVAKIAVAVRRAG